MSAKSKKAKREADHARRLLNKKLAGLPAELKGQIEAFTAGVKSPKGRNVAFLQKEATGLELAKKALKAGLSNAQAEKALKLHPRNGMTVWEALKAKKRKTA